MILAASIEWLRNSRQSFGLTRDTLSANRCLPGHPATVYWQRKNGSDAIICESDITMLEQGRVPVFYDYLECDRSVVTINYFVWYSHQAACLEFKVNGIVDKEFGAHKGDWERRAV
eukprot:TRINITY_DN9117_c0_g2_i1.p1 TRINITY_DN9117_c0_g2~~TRINITY_DN9117_c0_g2_i1.p1  ORF type:complete len:116 (-),score=12.11 TRINITY_DN9117_c0_g2_i1:93-440(-)